MTFDTVFISDASCQALVVCLRPFDFLACLSFEQAMVVARIVRAHRAHRRRRPRSSNTTVAAATDAANVAATSAAIAATPSVKPRGGALL